MTQPATTDQRDIFDSPAKGERFVMIGDPEAAEGLAILKAIAKKIGDKHAPHKLSEIPSGTTYLTQFAVHDLDFLTREGTAEESLLDLALIYGDGPRHDAFCYQVPTEPGGTRYLLRLGRTRPTATSPAWGAARDLPRESCPHLDAKGVDTKSEVLVPNSFSDNNALLAQMQTVWALAHNAFAGSLVEMMGARQAFEMAREITRGIYRDAVRNDVLGVWLKPDLRARFVDAGGPGLRRRRAPREFMAGVGRLGHGLIREIYQLNDLRPVTGLRDILRHTSSGRPSYMPLTEDWLVDFSRFFAIGPDAPQFARALGPHVARPIATGAGLAAGDPPGDSIVLRDLLACSRGDLCSVKTLIARAAERHPGAFAGCFAGDEDRWTGVLRGWLTEALREAKLDEGIAEAMARNPPLTLFLMIEADADTDGKTLGALGSIIMGETLSAALPDRRDDPAVEEARAQLFQGPAPSTMAELIRFLQRHYKFAEGARLHAKDPKAPAAAAAAKTRTGETRMFDTNAPSSSAPKLISRIEVADFIEMGRLIAQWSVDPATRPRDVAELKDQMEGIATVPERIKNVEFVQSTLETLVLRLPVKEMLEESLDRMSDPEAPAGQYPLPQFYADHYRPGFGPVMSPLDTLLARVGDYTIAQCR
ncbi:hypothetical protein [uncultured Amaricoccus sp.]|uniref:hypothetical protein n=2 Tax=Amaricoccus TaxID=56999 RepID=UPI00262548DC|nr:hypothetical protein [uncultured Amaricoccus sp.]